MKYSGKVGLSRKSVEVSPGVYQDKIVDKLCRGDILSFSSNQNQRQDSTNDDIVITNQLSIVADKDLVANVNRIVYATLHGTKWRVSSATYRYPRIILNLGGVYNE